MKSIKYLLNTQKEKLYTEVFEPDKIKETIIFCHGITGCRKGRTMNDNYFQELAIKLMELNYKVVLFDFSGHGESEGKDKEVSLEKSTSELAKIVAEEKVKKREVSFLAFSYGATVLCNFLSKNNEIQPRKIVLYSPALYPLESCFLNDNSIFGKDIVKEYKNGNLEKNGYALVGAKNFHFGNKMIKECKNFKPYYYERFKDRILVLTGKQDVILNTKYNEEFCKKNKIKNIYLEASHSLFEKIDEAFRYTIEYFES